MNSKNNTELAYFDAEGGPLIAVGHDFYGYGKILSLSNEKSDTSGNFKVRVECEQ